MMEIDLQVGRRVLVPDVGIFEPLPVDITHDMPVLPQLPLTAIEILSSRPAVDDLLARAEAYLAAGVRSAWVVLPKLQGVAVFSAPDTYCFFRGPDELRDPATGVALPVAPLLA